MTLYQPIENVILSLDITSISEERQLVLQPLIHFISNKKAKNEPISLNFICTHNSRRSHLSQIWAQTLASYFNVNHVHTYSGGTEATAMFPMVAKTLIGQGFKIKALSEGKNPVYSIKFNDNAPAIIGFSKTFDDDFNATSNFAAIMTCGHANENCPFVPGAEQRIPITFDDPKAFDNTPQQAEKYLERSLQIATELKYIFNNVK